MRKIPFFRKIQFKLTIAFLVPVAFIVILGYASFEKASEGIVKSYEESVNQTMQMMNQYLTLVLDTVQSNYKEYLNDDALTQFYKGLYDNDVTKRYTVPKQYTTDFHGLVTADAMISNIYVLADREESIGTGKLSGEKLYSEYFKTKQGAMVDADRYSYFVFGNKCEMDEMLGTDSSKYGARLVRYMNNAGTVLVVDISRECVENTLASLDGGFGSYTALVTCDGVEYIKTSGEMELSEGITGPENLFVETEFYQKALETEDGEGAQYVEYQGKRYLFLYSKLSGRSAMICSLIPEENIVARVADIKKISIVLVVVAAIAAIGMGCVIAGSYGKTINRMVRKIRKVGEGDLTVQISTRRKDEFLLLAEGITEMTTNMKALITNVTDASRELADAAEWVFGSSNTFIETSDGIKQAIKEIETGTSRLDTDSADCLEEMDTLSKKIGFVSENAGNISSLTNEAKTAVTSGMSSMDALNESAASTTQITEQVIDAIRELEEKSKAIGQIIKTINDIAEETNLLSLNASIEAARAGEAGKGFAVVAGEIKKLADESMTSSARIGEIVEEIVAKTGQVVEVAKRAEEVVRSQEEAVDRTAGSFEAIQEKVTSLMESLTQIEQNVCNMEQARANTLSAITSISAVSAETASGSTTVYTAAGKQTDTVEELQEAAGKLSTRAEELTDLLQKFKIE